MLVHGARMIGRKPRVNALNMKGMAAMQRTHHLVRFQQLQADRTLNRRRAAVALKRVGGQLRENLCRRHPRLRHGEIGVGEVAVG